MQIRRSSRLNCFNSVAVGYPVGLIIDGEKGNTVEQAQADKMALSAVSYRTEKESVRRSLPYFEKSVFRFFKEDQIQRKDLRASCYILVLAPISV